jgi:hypothetical protein
MPQEDIAFIDGVLYGHDKDGNEKVQPFNGLKEQGSNEKLLDRRPPITARTRVCQTRQEDRQTREY